MCLVQDKAKIESNDSSHKAKIESNDSYENKEWVVAWSQGRNQYLHAAWESVVDAQKIILFL